MRSKNLFLNAEEEQKVVQAIQKAEQEASGEIRVHIQNRPEKGISTFETAQKVFFQSGMDQTQQRNGVLFYVGVIRRSFTILGDEGINKTVPTGFWYEIKDRVIQNFKAQKYCKGLIEGITMAGQALKTHFPYQKDDINELLDDISKD
ncbi:MAG: TPM domain-containing protein [Flavobacteriales bacterium AspAUS03]